MDYMPSFKEILRVFEEYTGTHMDWTVVSCLEVSYSISCSYCCVCQGVGAQKCLLDKSKKKYSQFRCVYSYIFLLVNNFTLGYNPYTILLILKNAWCNELYCVHRATQLPSQSEHPGFPLFYPKVIVYLHHPCCQSLSFHLLSIFINLLFCYLCFWLLSVTECLQHQMHKLQKKQYLNWISKSNVILKQNKKKICTLLRKWKTAHRVEEIFTQWILSRMYKVLL